MFLPSSECGVDSNQVLRFLLCTVVAALAVTEPALNGQVGSQPSANPRGNLHATALKASYRESSGHELLVGQIHLQALSLTAGDFNNDGYPDLVAGYGTAGGTGRLLIHLANTEAFSPQLQDSLSAI